MVGETTPEILALDTGGTMTDSIVVDHDGRMTVGKAQTTPQDESEGVVNSFSDALGYWDQDLDSGARDIQKTVYSGTAMLNRLVEREGEGNIGLITNHGFEDTHRFGRGIQVWAGLSYSGRLHAREHEHPEPIILRDNIEGVRGRIDQKGDVAIPLYEEEARDAVHELLDKDVRIICVCLLHSYDNPVHERKLKEIADEVKAERDDSTPIWLSHEQNPIRGELARINTLAVEAYAVEPSREQFINVRDRLASHGSTAPLRVLTGSGDTVSPEHDWLVDTMISGPVGGVFGAEYLMEQLGFSNMICTDVGGTSFEAALITEGHYPTRWDQALGQFMINIPMPAMDTIGSGTGSFVNIDRKSGRIDVGPESAGSEIGVCNRDADLDTPTITDCTAILGYLNPDFFLGGDIDIDVDRAREVIDDQIATPLGQDPYEAARGVVDIVEQQMTTHLKSMIFGQGYTPENYRLASYGGGGPLHVAGYAESLNFKDVIIPEWAAAFSAFGCAAADYAYRYAQTADLQVDPDYGNIDEVVDELQATLQRLHDQVADSFERDGMDPDEMRFKPTLYIRYSGMEEDLEIRLPERLWDGGLDEEALREIIDIYETRFTKIFRRAAKSPEKGYTISTIVGRGVQPSTKPELPEETGKDDSTPPESANKGERPIYWNDEWQDAQLWRMHELNYGNVVDGPAVIEAPATTMLIPPNFEANLDENRIFHLTQQE